VTFTSGNFTEEGLAYVDTDALGNAYLEFMSGLYSPTAANSSAQCASSCVANLPIQWSNPTVIATFGTAGISGLAAASSGEAIAVAAASGTSTYVYASFELGDNNTWVIVTNGTPLAGTSPGIAITRCGILVTTLTTQNLTATTFPMNCRAYPSANPPVGYEGIVNPLISAPTVTSVYLNYKTSASTVLVNGTNFETSGLVVDFEHSSSKWAATTTYDSPTQLTVTPPTGPPTGVPIDVVVTTSAGTSTKSAADEFFYPTLPAPIVTGIVPASGPAGTMVNITGTAFLDGSTVKFGANSSTTIAYISPDKLVALAPWAVVGSKVDIRVTDAGGTSAIVSADKFTYTLGTRPTVTSVTPNYGGAGTAVAIDGTGYISTATVKFGPNPATSVTFLSSTALSAIAPLGSGTVDVLVNSTGLQSSASVYDLFSYPTPLPGSFARITTLLPKAVSAAPVWTTSVGGANGTLAVFASLVGTKEFEVYSTTVVGSPGYTGTKLFPLNLTAGSRYFTSIGDTLLQTPKGVPGQVSAVAQGGYFTAFVTDQEQNRTVLRSIGSSTAGATWGPDYLTGAPTLGSFVNIEAASSPAGYVYVAGLDTGTGVSEADQMLFSVSGSPLLAPQALVGSRSVGPNGPTDVSVSVDALERPVYIWNTWNASTNVSDLFLTGAMLTPSASINLLQSTFDSAPTDDFLPVSQSALTAFRSQINANLTSALTALSEGHSYLCSAEHIIASDVYPRLTSHPILPLYTINTGCGATIGTGTSDVSPIVGALDINATLGVLGERVLEAFGFAVFPSPPWPGTPMTGSFTIDPLSGTSNVVTGTPGKAESQQWGDWMFVTPQGINPTAVFLNLTPGFITVNSSSRLTVASGCQGATTDVTEYSGLVYVTRIASYSEELTFGTQNQLYSGLDPEGFYLTNLTPNSHGSWTFSAEAIYAESENHIVCDKLTSTSAVNPVTLGPASVSLSAMGNWSTEFGTVPASPIVRLQPDGSSDYFVTAAWNNTLYASGNASLKLPNAYYTTQLKPPALADSTNFSAPKVTGTYTFYANMTDEKGGRNGSWTPILDTNDYNSPVSPTTISSSCTIQLTSTLPVSVTIPSSFQSNITGTDSTLTWYANASSTSATLEGWIRYHEGYGPGFEETAPGKHYTGSTMWRFQVQLHGLTPWGYYYAQLGASGTVGGQACAIFQGAGSVTFQTTAVPHLSELDRPYDSITHEGGGAEVYFPLPPNVLQHGTAFSLFVTYYNTSLPANVTDLPLTAGEFTVIGPTVSFNLSALQPNTIYALAVDFNYTYANASLTARNSSFSFWYLRDTSGDGLSDAEKVGGWPVTLQTLGGTYVNENVTADPYDHSTNGLVSDYTEKELGLNPQTLDTAGSHMLDTWNLTFDVGPTATSALPTGIFRYWYENSSYIFNRRPQFPGGPVSFSPARHEANNVNDSYSLSSEALWTGLGTSSGLVFLEGLIDSEQVGWLRAVTGEYNDGFGWNRTITVEGKLSWGANSLAQSSTGNDIADGSSVDPLGAPYLEVSIDHWNGTSTFQSGDGVAPFIESASGSGSGRTVNYAAWGPNVTSTGGLVAYTGPFNVTFPVVPTYQTASVNITIMANIGGNDLSEQVTSPGYSVDLLQKPGQEWYNTTSGELHISYQVLYDPGKAQTYLLAPANNTTLSNAPWGLKRYTAEQDFDLLVLNDTASGGNQVISISTTGVPGAEGGWSYSITIQPGLNNILVPRALFLASPLGQTLLNGSAVNPRVTATGTAFSASDWFNRVNQSTTSNTSSNFIRVFSTNSNQGYNSSKSALYGGIPSNSQLEVNYSSGANYEALQVQSVIWINVSNQGDGVLGSGASELQNLIGGLIQNTSGNLSANILAVTGELMPLGLSANVLSALANASYNNGGQYGGPLYNKPATGGGNSWTSWGATLWNDVSGVTGDLGRDVSAVWSNAIAAWAFGAALGSALATKLGLTHLANQIGSALKAIGTAMWDILILLRLFIIAIVDKIFLPIVTPVLNALTSYGTTVNSTLTSAYQEENIGGSVSGATRLAFWNAVGGSVFTFALGLGLVVSIALIVSSEVDFGAGFVVGILASLLLVGLAAEGKLPSISGFTSAGVSVMENFLRTIHGLASIFTSSLTQSTLTALASTSSGVGALFAYEFLEGAAADSRFAASVLVGIIVLSFALDSLGFLVQSPFLILFAFALGAIGTGAVLIAGYDSEGLTASLVAFAVVSGGFAVFIDLIEAFEYGG